MWVAGYIYWVMLAQFAARVANRIKQKYLEAILEQECAWFDQVNYTELSSRIARETSAIQKGLGEKAGQLTLNGCMFFAGLAVGFYMGWLLALVLLGMIPAIGIIGYLYGEAVSGNVKKSLVAYSQSAGYAEQAFSAIRVVAAFGMEKVEFKNYSDYLTNAKKASLRNHAFGAFAIGAMIMIIYCCYAYAFYFGALFVEKEYYNHGRDRAYSGGDSIGVFFAVIIGLFSLALIANQYKAYLECKVAAKMAFDIIDRKSPIPQDDPKAEKHMLQGEIQFKNIDFYYPTRPEQYILKGFNATFAKGKTTAIVGASGAGKSSIAQLVERFYEPENGQVLVDGKDIKDINLTHYRNQIGYVPQEPVLFNTSIKENIKMGKLDATDDEIEEALKASNAWDFVQ